MLTRLKNNVITIVHDERIATNANSLIARLSIAVVLIIIFGYLNAQFNGIVQTYDIALLCASALVIGILLLTKWNAIKMLIAGIATYIVLLPVSAFIFSLIAQNVGMNTELDYQLDSLIALVCLGLFGIVIPLIIRKLKL